MDYWIIFASAIINVAIALGAFYMSYVALFEDRKK
jgi:hypothetical protein